MFNFKTIFIILFHLIISNVYATTYDPCTIDNTCLGLFKIPKTNLGFPYYASKPLTEKNDNITKVMLMVHGIYRKADKYYTSLKNVSASSISYEEEKTILIAPWFIRNKDLDTKNIEPKLSSDI